MERSQRCASGVQSPDGKHLKDCFGKKHLAITVKKCLIYDRLQYRNNQNKDMIKGVMDYWNNGFNVIPADAGIS